MRCFIYALFVAPLLRAFPSLRQSHPWENADGLLGLRYYQVSGNSGSYLGMQRAVFPGAFLQVSSFDAVSQPVEDYMALAHQQASQGEPRC